MPITPIARKLDMKLAAEFTPPVLSLCRRELATHQTRCEFPVTCAALATTPYRNRYSVVYLCDIHWIQTETTVGADRTVLDRAISEHMYQGLLSKSYVWMNVQTGGALDNLVDSHQVEVKRAANQPKRTAARLLAERRGLIEKDALRVGAPDEDLLTGRDRGDLREKLGKPRIGRPLEPKVVTPVAVPRLRSSELSLITPSL